MAHPPNYKSDLLPKQCLSAALRESDMYIQIIYIYIHVYIYIYIYMYVYV